MELANLTRPESGIHDGHISYHLGVGLPLASVSGEIRTRPRRSLEGA
jgi:hypothetical protein